MRTTMALRGAVAACAGGNRNSIPFGLHLLTRSSAARGHLRSSAAASSRPQTGLRFRIRAMHESAPESATATAAPDKNVKSDSDWKIKMLYDGDCPLCMREVNMLRERNKEYGTIKFVDISSDDYSPEEHQGLEYETVMGKIHAIMSDGTVVTNVEAFRKLYEAVGLGWVYAITKYEPVATMADAVYNVWAKYRLPITGRPPLEQVLEARKKRKEEVCNDNNSCKM
uniref:Thiol-disulfide oxudoreductase DCC n=1 Tax=Kalanchoe fedtschenkoi TaxID=63787 RepID=A0A7N0TWR5_KALFE